MARSCGIRIGPRRFELVVLDGSAKKHKITAYKAGELPRDGEDPVAAAAAVLRQAVKEHDVPRDNVGIAIDTGLAAFRTLKMPFAEKDKIEQVVKFEVESLLPQWSIDEVIVDFIDLESTPDSSELLVTAVQKQDLGRVLALAERAGIEPLEAELETTAMVNAAFAAGIPSADTAQLLVHIGELSTSVVVIDAGHVREMRAIHIGALSHEASVPPIAPDVPAAETPAGEAPPAAAAEATPEPIDTEEVQRRLDQAIRRIRRELGRTVSATRTAHPIDSIYVCGFDVPGLVGSTVADVPVRVLDVFEKDGGQPATGFGQLVVPYGVALRQLGGGVLKPSLRREELRYTGAFERVELPLSVVCLLIVTLLAVWNIFLYKEETSTNVKLGIWRDNAQRYLLGDPKKGIRGYLEFPSEGIARYAGNMDADTERNKFEQLEHVRALLQGEVKKLEKDLGQDADIGAQPQSALRALALVLDVLDRSTAEGARPSLRKVRSTYQPGRAGKPDTVRVGFDVSFFSEDPIAATRDYEHFKEQLSQQPWHVSFETRPSTTLEDSKGIFLQGIAVIVDVSKAPPVTVNQ